MALFRKEFDDPIELVRTPASGDLLELRNADSAFVNGVNSRSAATWLFRRCAMGTRRHPQHDSLVRPGREPEPHRTDSSGSGRAVGIQTSSQRPLRDQSPYLTNLALTWFDPNAVHEATLLYNVAGKRVQGGLQGLPDEYEQPFHQLDFSYSRAPLPTTGSCACVAQSAEPEAEFTQGDEVSRRYRKGREIAVNLEWSY